MSKKAFDAEVEKRFRKGDVKFTTAKHYGPDAIIITNRLIDLPGFDPITPHLRVRCDRCGALCPLHPETLKQSPEATIVCAHCTDEVPTDIEIRANPKAFVEELMQRWRDHKPKGRT